MRLTKIIALSGLLLLPGCAGGGGLGGLGDILGSVMGAPAGGQQQGQGQLQAEIQQVDTRSQRLHVRTQQGQTGSLLYDQQTVVVYQQQQYPVTALERGDIVNIQAAQTNQNELYASRIDVVQSVQERQGR